MYKYSAFGLCVDSCVELAGFVSIDEKAVADVVIRRGDLASYAGRGAREFHVKWGADEFAFFWDRVGTYAVRNGREIVIDSMKGVDDQIVQLPLPGILFGGLLHQRGLTVLHASCVKVDGKGIAFVGHKYAGKSTMSAAMTQRGHALIADDTVAIDLATSDETAMVMPGIPRLHLWPDAVESLVDDPSAVPTLHEGGIKRGLVVESNLDRSPAPLHAIYVLTTGEDIAIEQLSMRNGIIEILPHTWAMRFMEDDKKGGAMLFQSLVPLVKAVPVRRLIRRRSLEELRRVVDAVENDIVVNSSDPIPESSFR